MELQRCIWSCLANSAGNNDPRYHSCVEKRCVAQNTTPTLSKAADYLVHEQIDIACDGNSGTIDSGAVIERDLTGDGKADLVISHEGITCGNGGRSNACGAQVCSVMIYVRRGRLLKLEREMLGAGVSVRGTAIHMSAHGGRPGTVQWNGREFR